MSEKLAKRIRRVAAKNDYQVAMEFKAWINGLPFRDRVRIAWKAIMRKM